jgi:hypothetical protein
MSLRVGAIRLAAIIKSSGSVTTAITQNLASSPLTTSLPPPPRNSPCQTANNTQQIVVNAKIHFKENRNRQFGGNNGGGSGSGVKGMRGK